MGDQGSVIVFVPITPHIYSARYSKDCLYTVTGYQLASGAAFVSYLHFLGMGS